VAIVIDLDADLEGIFPFLDAAPADVQIDAVYPARRLVARYRLEPYRGGRDQALLGDEHPVIGVDILEDFQGVYLRILAKLLLAEPAGGQVEGVGPGNLLGPLRPGSPLGQAGEQGQHQDGPDSNTNA